MKKPKQYAFSTTIYIYGDKPEYYLHGNRLQYLQSQDWKQTGNDPTNTNNSTQVGFFVTFSPDKFKMCFRGRS